MSGKTNLLVTTVGTLAHFGGFLFIFENMAKEFGGAPASDDGSFDFGMEHAAGIAFSVVGAEAFSNFCQLLATRFGRWCWDNQRVHNDIAPVAPDAARPQSVVIELEDKSAAPPSRTNAWGERDEAPEGKGAAPVVASSASVDAAGPSAASVVPASASGAPAGESAARRHEDDLQDLRTCWSRIGPKFHSIVEFAASLVPETKPALFRLFFAFALPGNCAQPDKYARSAVMTALPLAQGINRALPDPEPPPFGRVLQPHEATVLGLGDAKGAIVTLERPSGNPGGAPDAHQ